MLTKRGHCLCGAVAFEAEVEDGQYGACHCGMCRRWAGGPFFAKETEALGVTRGADKIVSYRSSDWAERAHCAVCGSNLWYYLVPKQQHIVAIGAFDDQSDMVLAAEIYIDHKPGGYALAGNLKRMTEAEVIAAVVPGGTG
ncbi:MAG TPA: GFA family protein [Paracoccaceae bacterium]|nr:GFA family protein [Paracoccaceae bacterium]